MEKTRSGRPQSNMNGQRKNGTGMRQSVVINDRN